MKLLLGALRSLILARDIYYRDPELFIKQAVVDRYVDDIAFTLGVDRDALNVVSLLLIENVITTDAGR